MPIPVLQLTGTGWRDLATPPPPATSMLVGAASYHPPSSSQSSFTTILEPQVGPMTVRRSYDGDAIPTSWETSEASIDVGVRASVWSVHPPIVDFAAGAHDTALRTFLRTIPDDGMPKFLIGWHEADSKVRRGNYTRAEYLAAAARFADVIHEEAVPNTYVTSNHTCWLWNDPAQAAGDPEQYWIDGAFDVWSVDEYQGTPSAMFAGASQFAADHGIPWAVAETGKTDVADTSIKAQWISDVAAYCSTRGAGGWPSAVFMAWFDSSVGFDASVAEQSFTPTSSAASIAAANEVCQAYYRDPRSVIL